MGTNPPTEFTPAMVAFLEWFFRTLDPKFTERVLAGRTIEEAAQAVFLDVVAKVRGNRATDAKLTAADYGAMMDRIAALHLRTRHGEGCVAEEVV